MVIESKENIEGKRLRDALKSVLEGKELKKVLILPPDYTRLYSGAGIITAEYYSMLTAAGVEVDVMPALGTHEPMTREECENFFLGAVPFEKILVHNWRTEVVKIGEVPSEFVSEVSEGLVDSKIDVEVNRRLLDKSYDLIISVGQVVPHEVVGMANYSKNIFVGCGGSSMINSSHMLGAFYGLERIMGRDFSPVRRVFDYAQEHFLSSLPLVYVLTVTTNEGDKTNIHGLYIGTSRSLFEQAVSLSREKNLNYVREPLKKVVVYLDPREFKSTWLGNKAVYRTRLAIADGGELIVLAPGVRKFGEDEANDMLIRKYGYVGRERVLELVKECPDLNENLSVAAHLIHGSSDGRFSICYCTKEIGEEEVRGVNFDWRPYDEEIKKFDPTVLTDGYNYSEDGEEFYYISNPALGLWDVDPDMEKLIDLHTHSTRSDGSMTPTELVRHAKKCGLAAIALSDHDSVEGVAEAMAEGERIGVEVVPALEFSVKSATETHILGYFVDIENAELKDALVRANEVRRLRNNRTCDELRKLGFDVTVEEALAIAPGGMIGRAHYARLLVEKGYTKSVREGFDKYMSVGKPAYCEQQALTAKEAIEVTHAAGGLAFCAHLHLIKLPDDELERFLTELKGYGLDGIEGYYTDYDDEMGERYRAMAERLGLAVSGGTDFHAKMKPHISIGKGLGNMAIPYSVLENIKKLLKTEDK